MKNGGHVSRRNHRPGRGVTILFWQTAIGREQVLADQAVFSFPIRR